MTATIASRQVIEAHARGAVYALLARAFAYPEAAHRELMEEMAGALAGFPDPTFAAVAELAGSLLPLPELEIAFVRVFTHSTSRDCPAFETAYTSTETFQQAQQMADIAGFYRAFGVLPAPGTERPDHITAELEFMQFLTAKEAYARETLGWGRVRQCRRAQTLFLRDHLGIWGPAFGRRLEARDPAGWYGRAGRLLGRWLEEECRAFHVVPAEIDAPQLPWPEPDNGTCATDVDTADMEDSGPCAGCVLQTSPPTPPLRGRGAGGSWPVPKPGSPFPPGKGAGGIGLPLPILER